MHRLEPIDWPKVETEFCVWFLMASATVSGMAIAAHNVCHALKQGNNERTTSSSSSVVFAYQSDWVIKLHECKRLIGVKIFKEIGSSSQCSLASSTYSTWMRTSVHFNDMLHVPAFNLYFPHCENLKCIRHSEMECKLTRMYLNWGEQMHANTHTMHTRNDLID